jgi:hypothetical protein
LINKCLEDLRVTRLGVLRLRLVFPQAALIDGDEDFPPIPGPSVRRFEYNVVQSVLHAISRVLVRFNDFKFFIEIFRDIYLILRLNAVSRRALARKTLSTHAIHRGHLVLA